MKDLCIRESYEQNGEQKVKWNKIGVLFESNGKTYLKLFHIPNTLISVFEQKKKDTPAQSSDEQWLEDNS